MDETRITQIIKRRKNGSLTALLLITAVFCYMIFKGEVENYLPVIIVVIAFDVLFIYLWLANQANLPLPKPSYRKLNKIFYLYIMKIAFVLSILEFILNIKRFLNPFENYKKPGNPTHTEYLANATVGGIGGAYVTSRAAKSAEVVEEYFKQIDKASVPNQLSINS